MEEILLRDIRLTEFEKNHRLNLIKTLEGYIERSEKLSVWDVDFLKSSLPYLLGILPIKLEAITGFSLPFERLVINESIYKSNKRLKSLENLRYPPRKIADKIGYNRANLPGQIIFYGSSMGRLATAVETRPKLGQLTTISKWDLKKGNVLKMLIVCQDFDIALSNPEVLLDGYNEYIKELNLMEENTRLVVTALYKFITNAFVRKVDTINRQGYLFSALLSDLFFKNPDIDAIYYPSVPNKGASMNIAIKPDVVDEMFIMTEATEDFVFSSPSTNSPGWLQFPTGKCKSYSKESLELNWESVFITEEQKDLMRMYKVDLT